jgi:hypothetical protein
MLINKGFTNGDVVSLKLVNGDELIARFEEETADTLTISKPLAITIGPQGLGMMPWMFLGNSEKFKLSKTHVFTMVASKEDASKQYLEGTTGIALK